MRQHTSRNRHRSGGVLALIFAVLLAAVTFAGCLEGGLPGTTQDPEAVLMVDDEELWAGQTVDFDGGASTPPEDGEIVKWRFDVDGETVHEAETRDDAVYEHEFSHGGVYNVTLTVTAEYENGDERSDMADHTLAVQERFEIEEMAVQNLSLGDNLSEEAQRGEADFEVHAFATAWELDLQVENNNPLQPSEFTVRIYDGDDQLVEEESYELSANDNATIQLGGSQPEPGNYTFELEADSGSVSAQGRIDVRYSADAA